MLKTVSISIFYVFCSVNGRDHVTISTHLQNEERPASFR